MPFAQKPTPRLSPSGMESRIRRAAEKHGLRAIKSRWRRGSAHNKGGWAILDARSSFIVVGDGYALSDAAVLDFLETYPRTTKGPDPEDDYADRAEWKGRT